MATITKTAKQKTTQTETKLTKAERLKREKARGARQRRIEVSKMREQIKVQSNYMADLVGPRTDDTERKRKLLNIGRGLTKVFNDHIKNKGGTFSLMDAAKALSTATDASGGFAVADDFNSLLVEKRYRFGSVSNIVRRIPTNSDTIKNVIEDDGAPAVRKQSSQGASITESNITLAGRDIKIYDNFVLIWVNNQTIRDWAVSPSAVELVVDRIARALTLNEEKEILQGTGDADEQATGLATKFTNSGFTQSVKVAGSEVNKFSVSDMIDLYHALRPEYRVNGTFVLTDAAVKNMYDFGNTNTNRYFIPAAQTGSAVPGQVGTFMGRPVVTTQYIADNLNISGVTANKASAAIFGDFDFYGVGDSIDNDIETDGSVGFDRYRTAVRGVKRFGGQILLDEAFAVMYYTGS